MLLEDLKKIAELTKGSNQGEFYARKVESAKAIQVVSVKEVLTERDIKWIKEVLRPKCKECYKNAMRFAMQFNCLYVEGQYEVCGFGTDHAFNKIGGKYVDITAEFALQEKNITPAKEYLSIAEYTNHDAMDYVLKMGCYDSVFNFKYMEELKNGSKNN